MPEFMPRSECGPWTKEMIAIYIVANTAIFLSYIAIGIQLIVVVKVEAILNSFRGVTKILFATFIISCGFGHLFDGVMPFFYPEYPLITAWHCLTAISSVGTAVFLPRLMIGNIMENAKHARGNSTNNTGR